MKQLAFIIITYNRPADMLELLENIMQLNHANELIEEIIVVNNASTADYYNVKRFSQINTLIPIIYIDSNENLGVAKGRNYALKFSKSPILILLDDDATLQNKDALTNLIKEFEFHNTRRTTAIVSFKVLYHDTLDMQKNALPHKKYEQYKDKHFFETYYYAGGAHAIRKEALEKAGTYPEDFFYGMEEYDLSYRILDSGYGIIYSDKIIMLHKESSLGRQPKADKIRMMWVNKAKVAWRYLPKRFFFTTSIMWSLQYLRITGIDLKGFILGWKQILDIKKTELRKPVKRKTLEYLKSLKARLWY